MTVEREIRCAGRQANQFDFKRRLAGQARPRLRILERQRHVAQKPVILSFRRLALSPGNVVQVYLFHHGRPSLTGQTGHHKKTVGSVAAEFAFSVGRASPRAGGKRGPEANLATVKRGGGKAA